MTRTQYFTSVAAAISAMGARMDLRTAYRGEHEKSDGRAYLWSAGAEGRDHTPWLATRARRRGARLPFPS